MAAECTTGAFKDATPSPGDVTVCIGCAGVLFYGARLELVVPDAEALTRLHASELWPAVKAVVQAVHAVQKSEGRSA